MKKSKSASQTQNDPGEYEFDCGPTFPIHRKATLAMQNAQGTPEDDEEDTYLKNILLLESCYRSGYAAIVECEFDDQLLDYVLSRCLKEIVYEAEMGGYPKAIVYSTEEIVQNTVARADAGRIY